MSEPIAERDAIASDYVITLVEDKPAKGQWHCGPNPAWVTVTHLPTMISATAFCDRQHKARQMAMSCVEMMVAESRLAACTFPDAISRREHRKDEHD